MASASSSSARNLFHDSKRRLADRVAGTVNNVASVGRQIVRGSKTSDVSVLLPLRFTLTHINKKPHHSQHFLATVGMIVDEDFGTQFSNLVTFLWFIVF